MRAAYLTIIALLAGLALGTAASAAESDLLTGVVSAIKPLGALWIAALRMTVIPLVIVLVITAVASAATMEAIGRIGGRTVAFFLATLLAFTALSVIVAPALFGFLSIPPETSASLRAGAQVPQASGEIPSASDWVANLLPTNPMGAAADGEMLPLLLFALLFALALTRTAGEVREPVLQFFEGIRDAMLVLVGWVILLAPVGVFALALGLGSDMGFGAAGAIAYYIAVVSGLLIVAIILMYPLAALLGNFGLVHFARAVAPAQVIAFGTRSSLASLPAMIEGAQNRLKLPASVTGFVLPLSASTFKPAAPISWIVGALFIGKLYGVELDAAELTTVAAVSVALSFSHPGIPSGSPALKVPLYLAVGLPVEGVAILLAVDAIPDFFKTVLNVTAPMAIAGIVGRGVRGELSSAAASPAE